MEEAQANQKTGPVNDAFKDLFNTALDDIWKGNSDVINWQLRQINLKIVYYGPS